MSDSERATRTTRVPAPSSLRSIKGPRYAVDAAPELFGGRRFCGLFLFLGRLVSAIVFYIGYLWMLWDKEKQCWHDKFAGDLVVPVT